MQGIGQESFLVCSLQLDGRGDIYGAHEIALRVQRLKPEAKVVFTVLKPQFSFQEMILFQNKKFVSLEELQKEENWEIAKESDVLSTLEVFKAIIVYPTYHDSLLPKEILDKNECVIKLRENSVCPPNPDLIKGPTYTLGLVSSQDEKGVLIPLEFSKGVPPRNTNMLERLLHLEKVDPVLSKLILGRDFSRQAAEEFQKSSKMYLGYFSQPEVFMCYVNALLTCKKGSHLTICNTQYRPEGLIEDIKPTLWKNGFGHVRIIEFSSATKYKIESKKFNTGNVKSSQPRDKVCTIIFRPLTGSEFEAMLEASEDESLTTGDLSPYRFLAHRKTIAYDTRDQKKEAAESMVALAGQFNRQFLNLLPQAYFGAKELREIIDVKDLTKGMVDFFTAMENPGLKSDWDRYIDEIFAKHDFTPNLEKILKERELF